MVVPDVSNGHSAYIFRVKQSGLLDSRRNPLLVLPPATQHPQVVHSSPVPLWEPHRRHEPGPAWCLSTLFVCLYIHFCFFRQITLKKGVNKTDGKLWRQMAEGQASRPSLQPDDPWEIEGTLQCEGKE